MTAQIAVGRKILLLTILGAALTNHANAQKCRQPARVEASVRAVADGIIAADNKRDLKSVLAFYARDAILMPPAEGRVVGVENIRPRYEALFANFQPAIEARIEEVCVRDDLALVRGHNGGRLVGIGTNASRDLDDVYLMMLRRNQNGVWRISHLIWHRASSPPAK